VELKKKFKGVVSQGVQTVDAIEEAPFGCSGHKGFQFIQL
jgi:hypothetical protein